MNFLPAGLSPPSGRHPSFCLSERSHCLASARPSDVSNSSIHLEGMLSRGVKVEQKGNGATRRRSPQGLSARASLWREGAHHAQPCRMTLDVIKIAVRSPKHRRSDRITDSTMCIMLADFRS